jgi:tRNA A37 N6-isopentenylltransferase MiaA
MLDAGWGDEVKALLREGVNAIDPGFTALGYSLLGEAVAGQISWEFAEQKIRSRTREYAKKQITFFRHQFSSAQPATYDGFSAALRLGKGNPQSILEILGASHPDSSLNASSP